MSRCPGRNLSPRRFPDRVDAHRQREFGYRFSGKFLDLAGNGISNATGLAINRDNDTIYVVQPEEGKGGVYAFNVNGSFERKVTANVNLDGVDAFEFIRERLCRVESGESKSLPTQ